jgi:hypothetical protein
MAPRDDSAYNAIVERLKEAWKEYDSTARCVKISSNIFKMWHKTSYLKSQEDTAMSALDMVKI